MKIKIKFSLICNYLEAFFLFKFVNVNTDNNQTYQLKAKFLKAGGISSGNDVKMRGVKIGVVSNVYLDKDYFAVVDFQVYTKISVPKNSVVKIASDGILGNKYLSVTPIGSNLDDILLNNQEIKEFIEFIGFIKNSSVFNGTIGFQ